MGQLEGWNSPSILLHSFPFSHQGQGTATHQTPVYLVCVTTFWARFGLRVVVASHAFLGMRIMGLVSKQHRLVGAVPNGVQHFLVFSAL